MSVIQDLQSRGLITQTTDDGMEYKDSANHTFGVAYYENGIGQKFTQVARPQTNGKAERVIRTLMEMWGMKSRVSTVRSIGKRSCAALLISITR